MTVNTKQVTGRRDVHYDSYGDLLADAERLSNTQVEMLGNWSLGQILTHIAASLDSSIDGSDFSLPGPVRWLMSMLMKNKFLTKPIPAGFKSTKQFVPEPTSTEEGLAAIRQAIKRQEQEASRVPHPGFGKLTNEEWDAINLRHAEMHMSFAVPKHDAP